MGIGVGVGEEVWRTSLRRGLAVLMFVGFVVGEGGGSGVQDECS